MLRYSYAHIKGISKKTEQQLYEQGATTWDKTLENLDSYSVSSSVKTILEKELPKSIRLFEQKNYRYFLYHLPQELYYRVYPYLLDKVVFIDIETTGFNVQNSHITVVGCYDGREPKVFLFGENEEEFIDYIRKFSLVVTFNGKLFDIPFLEKYFGIDIIAFHIDLRYVLADLGYKGGLKKIEATLGLGRASDVCDVNGYTAVLLWQYYRETGDRRAFDTLIHYNLLDTVNLEPLLRFAYNKYAAKHNFNDLKLHNKKLPEIHYNYNREILDKIKQQSHGKA